MKNILKTILVVVLAIAVTIAIINITEVFKACYLFMYKFLEFIVWLSAQGGY